MAPAGPPPATQAQSLHAGAALHTASAALKGANTTANASSSGNVTADGFIDVETEAYSPGVAIFLMYMLLVRWLLGLDCCGDRRVHDAEAWRLFDGVGARFSERVDRLDERHHQLFSDDPHERFERA